MADQCERSKKLAEDQRHQWLLPGALLAALATFWVFFSARSHEFLELDDLGYVVENRHIDTLNWDTVVWAFTQFHEANWHPLTMLSLALDRQLWGMAPAGFILTNILLHCGTVFVCCFLFAAILTRVWPPEGISPPSGQPPSRAMMVSIGSIAGALFFGLHPLRVESVVWVSERKDVLCLFFLTSAMLCYCQYVRRREKTSPDGPFPWPSYALVLCFAFLALLSKPTAVSFPLLLLVLDWYPLTRITDRSCLLRVTVEKVPLFLLAAGTAGLTMLAQQEPLFLSSTLNLASKLLVAGKALIWYLWQTLWPTGLAPLYPHPGNVAGHAAGAYLGYGALVLLICLVVAVLARRWKIWAALWLFYLLSLIPMLGVVHVGRQWVADRYSYLPALALSLLWGGGIIWLVNRLATRGQKNWAGLVGAVAGCHLLICVMGTVQYLPHWRTTETIATREINRFPRQLGAPYHARANYFYTQGDYARALIDIDTALALALQKVRRDRYLAVTITRTKILRALGRPADALAAIEWGMQASSEQTAEAVALRDELANQPVVPEQKTNTSPAEQNTR